MNNQKNIAIFVSGNGTNCENIIRYFQKKESAKVALVISNREDAYALVRAQNLNVDTEIIKKAQLADSEYVLPILQKYKIDFIVLAGYLLMIPDWLIDRYPQSIINLHPSLIPKYAGKGMHGRLVHEAVKAAGEKETGISIHYVNNVCDGGEVIKQFRTSILEEDTVEDIEEKIHVLEQTYFPQVIESLL
ncbi:MAG: phosphoribosylglycinamide formyltransferase [Bacteroidaceae bacterium]|nr:phosphoribosylglycinamide formyltransferase [Bacteroidaceae bacterium]